MVTTKLNLSMTEPQVRQIYAKQGDTGRVLDITLDQTPEDGTIRILRPDGVEVTSEAVTGGEISESGETITFESMTEADVTELTVGIEPVQDLSHGDPSPSNICPITGHDEVVVSRTGKNLFDVGELTAEDWDNLTKLVSVDADTTSVTINVRRSGLTFAHRLLKLHGNATYTLSAEIDVTGFRCGVALRKMDDSGWMTGSDVSIPGMSYNTVYAGWYKDVDNTLNPTATFTIPECLYWCPMIGFNNGGSAVVGNDETIANIQIEFGSSATEYEPYQGSTYTTSLGQTVYGGTLDMVSGVLTVTHGNIASYNGETLPSTWISDRDVYASGTTPTTGAQVVYELATPLTYTLTAQQIKTLVGTNNVWATSGQIVNITFTYGGLLSELPSDATSIVGKCYCDVEQNGVSSMPFTLNVKKNERAT